MPTLTGSITISDVSDGPAGSDGLRQVTGTIYTNSTHASSTNVPAITDANANYDFDNGVYTLPSGWSQDQPTQSANQSNPYYQRTFNSRENTNGNSTDNFGNARTLTVFTGVVVFTNANEISDGQGDTQTFGNLADHNTIDGANEIDVGTINADRVSNTAVFTNQALSIGVGDPQNFLNTSAATPTLPANGVAGGFIANVNTNNNDVPTFFIGDVNSEYMYFDGTNLSLSGVQIQANNLAVNGQIQGNISGSSGSTGVTTSDNAPSSPTDGDLWYYTGSSNDDPRLYVYYDDGTNSQWIDAAPAHSLQLNVNGGDGINVTGNTINVDNNVARNNNLGALAALDSVDASNQVNSLNAANVGGLGNLATDNTSLGNFAEQNALANNQLPTDAVQNNNNTYNVTVNRANTFANTGITTNNSTFNTINTRALIADINAGALNAANNSNTTIDGGSITTGSLAAAFIDTTNLTAQQIAAINANFENLSASFADIDTLRAGILDAGTVVADYITAGEITAGKMDIDSNLTLAGANSGFIAGRNSASDFGTDGFYIGRTSTSGNTADGFQLSHTSVTGTNSIGDSSNLLNSGTVQAVIHDDDAGLRIYEPLFYQRGNVAAGNVTLDAVGETTTLSAGDIHYVTLIGGGGGGGGGKSGDTNNSGNAANAGGTGGTSTVVLTGASGYNGTRTYNAAGGAGGAAGVFDANLGNENNVNTLLGNVGGSSVYGGGGAGSNSSLYQASNPGSSPAATSYGAGGGGGAGWAENTGGNGGDGGSAAQPVEIVFDLTNANTDGTLTLNARGAGGAAGTANNSNSTASANNGGAGAAGVATLSGVLDGYNAITLADLTDGGPPWLSDTNAGNGTALSNSAASNNNYATVLSGSSNGGRWFFGSFRRQSNSLSTAASIGILGNGTNSFLVGTGAGPNANITRGPATNKSGAALTCSQNANSTTNQGYFYGYIDQGDNISARRTIVNTRYWNA